MDRVKDDTDISVTMESIFSPESIKISSFRRDYHPLLDLPEPIKEDVTQGKLGKSHAAEIVGIKDEAKQQKMVEIVKGGLNVQDTRKLVKEVKEEVWERMKEVEAANRTLMDAIKEARRATD